jgi:cytochrome P450 / NADPH-cytochrome P450 reductase
LIHVLGPSTTTQALYLGHFTSTADHIAGPIYKLSFFGHERVFVSSQELVNELCDEKRFCKTVAGPLAEARNGVHDGLFTAHHGEHAWGVAHRALVPAFGPLGIKAMFDEMYDIATQLVAKWARLGPDEPINTTDDYTRLTLDSIALCAMDKRFNSFYKEELHPFVNAMVGFLLESGRRLRRTRIEAFLNPQFQRQYDQDIALMRKVAAEVIAHRRANPTDKKDLLNAILFGKDPQTGERLTDESIMDNMITFLIAGHETTSGLLSFTTYYLLSNPEAMQKAQQEVDQVVGREPITFQHTSKLPYIEAVLRESLRLSPTAPAFSVKPLPGSTEPVVIGGGKYHIPKDQDLVVLLPQLHRDPSVFGADADLFRPERMYGENFNKLPPNSWKPFGNGARACIGRPFAWQEAVLALAMILQNFNIRFDDPGYQLHIKQTLTIKPADFFIKVSLRDGIDPIYLEKKLFSGTSLPPTQSKQPVKQQGGSTGKPMSIFYGSNSGTCEGLSQTLAGAAASHGYQAKVQPLDSAVDRFPTDEPVVLITASYEGQPPDNAAQFMQWLKTVDASKVKNSRFAVFGCGHHDWVSTFQKVPKLIDSILTEKGATAIVQRGETDVALGKIFDNFDEWQDSLLWPAITGAAPSDVTEVEALDMEISTSARASHLHHNVQDALVLKNELLTPTGVPEKRHVEVKLPTSMTYKAGDYLAVLPLNPISTISRVLRRFALPWDAMMTIKKGAHTTIPADQPMSVTAVLGAYVELSGPASRKSLAAIAQYASDDKVRESLLGADSLLPSVSMLDVLEAHPDIALPFSVYLSLLTPMRIRQYSISSSPLADPTTASITFAVVNDNDTEHPHLGVATNYLGSLRPGATLQLAVKKSHVSFHLPLDDHKTPVIMIAAGTGIAPFRGFIQERATKIAAAKAVQKEVDLAEAVLFIGCRGPQEDLLYKDLLDEWEKVGAVKVHRAFSRASELTEGCKYAQDRVWAERETVTRLFTSGARSYICGSGRLGKGVADVAARIHVENCGKAGREISYEKALKWWEGLRGERFAVDVFD